METIGKYRLVRKLAEGGMAEVFLAQVEGPGGFLKPVVVKRVLPELSRDHSFVSMFLGEAKLVAQLNHPNIVQVFDFGLHQGSYFLVMEFVDGFNLRGLFKRAHAANDPIPFELAARMVAAACEGLAYAHGFSENGAPLNLIHRDVSPENLLVGRNGVVKVADFGIARVAGQKRMTLTGTVRGKLVYMAPEQMQGEAVDCRVDVFALGIVLYELICARRPFEAKSEVEAMRAILSGTMIPASTWRPDMPPELQQIIDKAMARAPDRYKDCSELQLALEQFIARRGVLANTQSIAKFVEKYAEPVALPAPALTVILPPREQATASIRVRNDSTAATAPELAPVGKKPPFALIGVCLGIVAAGATALALWPAAPEVAAPEVAAPAAVAPVKVAAPAPPPAAPVVVDDYPVPPPPPPAPVRATARAGKVKIKSPPVVVLAAAPQEEAARVEPVEEPAKLVEPVEPRKEEPAPAAKPTALKGRLSGSGTSKGIILYNDTSFRWADCEVRMPYKRYFKFDDPIDAMGSDNIRVGSFENDHREPDQHMKNGWAMVRCREGSAYIWWGHSVP